MTAKYKSKLPAYDPRRKLTHEQVPLPCFHLTTEEKTVTSNNKKFSTKVIVVHTSESAAPMILHIMTKLEEKGDLEFIPSAFRQDHGIDAELKILQKHKEGIKNIVCLTVYNIREEMLERKRKVRRVPGSGESLSCSALFISIVKLEANVFTTS